MSPIRLACRIIEKADDLENSLVRSPAGSAPELEVQPAVESNVDYTVQSSRLKCSGHSVESRGRIVKNGCKA